MDPAPAELQQLMQMLRRIESDDRATGVVNA